MIDQRFVLLGALIGFGGGLTYVADTLRGRVRPNRVSWFLWSLAPLIAFAAELKEGVGLPAVMTFVVGVNPLLVLTASFVSPGSAWKISRFDLCCGLLSLIGLSLWGVTRQGDLAIAFAMAADALAAVPTLVKALRAPESESYLGFFGFGINGGITLLTIRRWTFGNYGFPLYICLLSLTLAALIRFRPLERLQRARTGRWLPLGARPHPDPLPPGRGEPTAPTDEPTRAGRDEAAGADNDVLEQPRGAPR